MSRLLLAFAVSAVVLSLLAPAAGADTGGILAQSSFDELAAPGPGHDFVVGDQRVTHEGSFQQVRVSAYSGPAGEDPKGSVRVTPPSSSFGGVDLRGDVVCLNVTGSYAQIAALLTEPFQGSAYVTLVVQDLGNPQMGQSPDFALIWFTSSPPADCAFRGGFTLVGDARGDLAVNDAI
jgi:hypothetical protein